MEGHLRTKPLQQGFVYKDTQRFDRTWTCREGRRYGCSEAEIYSAYLPVAMVSCCYCLKWTKGSQLRVCLEFPCILYRVFGPPGMFWFLCIICIQYVYNDSPLDSRRSSDAASGCCKKNVMPTLCWFVYLVGIISAFGEFVLIGQPKCLRGKL